MSGVMLLTPYLKTLARREGLELLAAAENKRRREIEQLLAERYPQPDAPTFVVPVASSNSDFRQLAPGPVGSSAMSIPTAPVAAEVHATSVSSPSQLAHIGVHEAGPLAGDADGAGVASIPGVPFVALIPAAATPSHARGAPLAPGRYALQTTIGQSAHDKLERLKNLLSHEISSGDLEQVFEKALDIAIAQLEKRKYGAAEKPRKPRARSKSSRHIPADVRRAVRQRDQERCTYVSPDGKHCEATTMLEYDHIVPHALGGDATVGNIRLRCRTHNQYEADQVYRAGFMKDKRERARADGARLTVTTDRGNGSTDSLAPTAAATPSP